MYYILFVCILALDFVCSHVEHNSECVSLNIVRRRPDRILILRQNFYNIDTLVYTAKDGYINEVIDDRGIIWKNDRGRLKLSKVIKFRKESKLLHVHYISADNLSYVKYFYRTGRVWNEINSERFYLEFDLHRSEASVVSYYTIYLRRNNDEKRARVNKSKKLKFAAYGPNYGYRINKVCDVSLGIMCFKSVWYSKEDEHCLFTSVHNRDKPDLAYLVISDSGNVVEKFYHKPPGVFKSWKPIDKTEYYSKLKERDLDLDKFDNTVQLDLNNIDSDKFYSSEFGYRRSTIAAYPKPGFRMTRVSYANMIIWESGKSDVYSYCANMFSDNEEPKLCYVLVSEGNERRIEYFLNNNNTWYKIDKKRFYHLLAKKDDPRYTHRYEGIDEEGNRNIEMSYFTNKQGLMVKTYRSMVPNHKGVILLIHGFAMHFLSTFMKYNMDWNYQNFGFATHPYIVCPDVNFFYNYSRFNYDRYKHIFEYNFYDKQYPSNLIQMFEYSGSMLECLNNMGYSVYGMDFQSNGFSESVDSIKSHFTRYTDLIKDVTQFVYIIKRQKFTDTSQVWTERVNSIGIKFNEKFMIFGYSLGSNVSFRAIEEFNRQHDLKEKLADAFISLSGMFDLASNIKDLYHRAYLGLFPLFAAFAPRYENRYQQYPNYGQRYNFTMYLNVSVPRNKNLQDDRYGPHFCSWRTLKSLYLACWASKRNAKHYPKNMPTLFIHSSEDYKCNIKGVRKIEARLGFNASVVEMPGRDHHTFETDFLDPISKNLAEWLATTVGRETIVIHSK
ncbi:conserved hypothetical protein [Theileria orientalis strain Shintoku]|uniref:Serine aminopeptidase S33 domain-containing protein n=1 Tax=Theileria orientalis strain Shintoku TaxID=869250 RepID=J4C7V0_THEOR|nr:conserved hypothetical protein [Theileria orientalis strain Shintoku]BAM39673.1 conserved hypothetical protein [Theileria orientalis strain Shintoku]|eukprot:XP_009689974.1 conserved hypothetical protein [Theileria orientalis strain Shintoku]